MALPYTGGPMFKTSAGLSSISMAQPYVEPYFVSMKLPFIVIREFMFVFWSWQAYVYFSDA